MDTPNEICFRGKRPVQRPAIFVSQDTLEEISATGLQIATTSHRFSQNICQSVCLSAILQYISRYEISGQDWWGVRRTPIAVTLMNFPLDDIWLQFALQCMCPQGSNADNTASHHARGWARCCKTRGQLSEPRPRLQLTT